MPESRRALLARPDPMRGAGPVIGLRGEDEIRERIEILREDAALPPISAGEVALLDAILAVQDICPRALARLGEIAREMPGIRFALERFSARLDALGAAGVDVATLDFEASYGRTQMEYYDGFVFGFSAAGRPDLPPVASGGRYDALTRRLGRGREIPAVGGVIRPDLVLALGGLS